MAPISSFTFGLLSIFVAFLVPFNFMEFKKLKKQRIIAGLTSIALFLMLLGPKFGVKTGTVTFKFDEFGAGGMFVAIIVAIFVSLVMQVFGTFSFFSEDSVIPDFVTAWFDSLLPIGLVITAGWLVVDLLHFDAYAAVEAVFRPLASGADTWWGFTLLYFYLLLVLSTRWEFPVGCWRRLPSL
ncbi:hypothetical protein [Bombilactobacillus apium]|uniref:hypothetical protein n=1 Tax=Bombilactobacillus apium TaxID=2675299 RepID=UPI001E515385|nr:hypothetical protein [Bombilactobacillus apium]